MARAAEHTPYKPAHKVRFVTAAALFDGHDATINIMRRILQATGVEVIHLGHNRSVGEIVNAALQEDVQGVAITSYQGGHVEFFKYMIDLLHAGVACVAFRCGGWSDHDLAGALAIYDGDPHPVLEFPAELRAPGAARLRDRGILGRPLVVHPGSGNPDKNWPVARYVEIITRWRALGREVVAVIGEADHDEAAALQRSLPDLPFLSGLTLPELGATLAECAAFLGNDSGITHLAAAVGLPVTALFGPSNPATWGTRGRGGVRILPAPEGELARLTVNAVWTALSES